MRHSFLKTTLCALTFVVAATSQAAPNAPSAANGLGAGAHIDGKNFKIDATAGDCKAGAECLVTVKLEALGDYHINKEYPYKIKVAEAPGVEFLGSDAGGKNVFSKGAGDFKLDGEKTGTMTIKFKPAKAGSVTVNGTYKMSVCSALNCQLETQELSVAVAAK